MASAQLSLIDPPRVVHTSRDASESQPPEKRETDRASLLRLLELRGAYGATDDEMQEALGLEGNTQRPRRKELEEDGAITVQRIGDTQLVRRTRTGRHARVWVLARHLR